MKPLQQYEWDRINPIFHSELSSSFLLSDIFQMHKEITAKFIEGQFSVPADSIVVKREHLYQNIGSIDIFMTFRSEGKEYALFLEVKVHDYGSAKSDQISRYCQAGLHDERYEGIFFVYLTQFNEKTDFTNKARPLVLFEESRYGKKLLQNRFSHLSWEEMHEFLDTYDHALTEEQQLLRSLQKQWILQKSRKDLEEKDIQNLGNRGLADYFPDVTLDITQELPFGEAVEKNRRAKWIVTLQGLQEEQLAKVLSVIKSYIESNAVNTVKEYSTEDKTLQEAKTFICELVQQVDTWTLASFYTQLFSLAEQTSYIHFYGTGTRGFSMKVDILGKGEISLCTIYRNKKLEFSLRR